MWEDLCYLLLTGRLQEIVWIIFLLLSPWLYSFTWNVISPLIESLKQSHCLHTYLLGEGVEGEMHLWSYCKRKQGKETCRKAELAELGWGVVQEWKWLQGQRVDSEWIDTVEGRGRKGSEEKGTGEGKAMGKEWDWVKEKGNQGESKNKGEDREDGERWCGKTD